MYYVALRFLKDPFEAEEAMQESFIKAFMKLHQFTGDVTFGAWLKRIVINKSIDMLKAKKMNMVAINEQVMSTVEEQDDWSVSDGTTVEEVKKYIEQYDHSIFIDDVFIYIDSSGKYLVVEPYQLIEGNNPNYVLSNFCPSITDNENARNLERYRNGEDFLKNNKSNETSGSLVITGILDSKVVTKQEMKIIRFWFQ